MLYCDELVIGFDELFDVMCYWSLRLNGDVFMVV